MQSKIEILRDDLVRAMAEEKDIRVNMSNTLRPLWESFVSEMAETQKSLDTVIKAIEENNRKKVKDNG